MERERAVEEERGAVHLSLCIVLVFVWLSLLPVNVRISILLFSFLQEDEIKYESTARTV